MNIEKVLFQISKETTGGAKCSRCGKLAIGFYRLNVFDEKSVPLCLDCLVKEMSK